MKPPRPASAASAAASAAEGAGEQRPASSSKARCEGEAAPPSRLESAAQLDAELAAWTERLVGGRISAARRLLSGNSRTTWAVDVERDEQRVALALRVDEGDGPYSGTPLTLAREAAAYAALQGHHLRMPRFYGYDGDLRVIALERVSGEPRWDEQVLTAVLAEAARLHALDVEQMRLPGFGRSARAELELWTEIAAQRIDRPSPVLDFAIEFLLRRFPNEPERLVLVHGDLGVGNAMWEHDKLVALLDWELAHVGDPHDDLAFLTVRTALHDLPLAGFGAAVRESYLPRAGLRLDAARLRYWQAIGLLRNLITCLASISNPVAGRDRLVHHMLIPPLERMLIGSLAAIDGIALPEPEQLPDPPRLPGSDLMDEIAHELADLPQQLQDPDRRQRARRMRYLFGQLARTWPLAAEIARREAEEPAASDPQDRLVQLAVCADRRLALLPNGQTMAYRSLASFDQDDG